MKFSPLILLILIGACSFKKNELANQTQNGHEELYSEPRLKIGDPPAGLKRIVVAATNDISGNIGPLAVRLRDKHNKAPLHIEIGGADIFSAYLKILRKKYQSVVLVDSGDILPPNTEDIRSVQDFYSALGYDALAPGLSDLGMRSTKGINPVRAFAADSKVPVLTSNLYEMKTARAVEWKGIAPYVLKEVDGIKIGIIGILPDDFSKLTPLDNRVGLYLENAIQSTLHQARRLRSLGAQIIVVLTHQGLECGKAVAEMGKLPLKKVNFDPRKEGICDLKGSLGNYLERLPATLVDVVVAGRNHQKVANFVNGIAVMSGFESGKSFSYVELLVDEKSGKLIPDKTRIHQPILLCREFFKETNDCFPEDPSIDHKSRTPAHFLEEPIERDEEIRTQFRKFFDEISVGKSAEVEELMELYGADLMYRPQSSGVTHLVLLELSGGELSAWLEKSFNLDEASVWSPSPFKRKNDSLVLSTKDGPLEETKMYHILADLESLQKKASLHSLISSNRLTSLTESSWQGSLNSDSVKVSASALEIPQRQ